ncbi:MAG: hypothetical protein ACTSYQ_04105, partial [Candidatus Odinarchaeia archaeon]
ILLAIRDLVYYNFNDKIKIRDKIEGEFKIKPQEFIKTFVVLGVNCPNIENVEKRALKDFIKLINLLSGMTVDILSGEKEPLNIK